MQDRTTVQDRAAVGDDRLLHVAHLCPATHALGPGRRAVVWVQGCPFSCPGCIAPEWIPQRAVRPTAVDDLAARLVSDPSVEGLTLSGGEPFLQPAALARLVTRVRAVRDVTVLCFTGYRLDRLRDRPPAPGTDRLLALLDVLVDGLYVERLDDGRGLRGSSNQTVHHLTARLAASDGELVRGRRRAEIHLDDGQAVLVGVPPPGLSEAFERAADRAAREAPWRSIPRTAPVPGGDEHEEERI